MALVPIDTWEIARLDISQPWLCPKRENTLLPPTGYTIIVAITKSTLYFPKFASTRGIKLISLLLQRMPINKCPASKNRLSLSGCQISGCTRRPINSQTIISRLLRKSPWHAAMIYPYIHMDIDQIANFSRNRGDTTAPSGHKFFRAQNFSQQTPLSFRQTNLTS